MRVRACAHGAPPETDMQLTQPCAPVARVPQPAADHRVSHLLDDGLVDVAAEVVPAVPPLHVQVWGI